VTSVNAPSAVALPLSRRRSRLPGGHRLRAEALGVWYDNNAAENGIQIHDDIAITMGNVYLRNAAGNEVMVDKTFVFRLGRDGKLRLCVHKSALPYSPDR
jgi:hypothetical protein